MKDGISIFGRKFGMKNRGRKKKNCTVAGNYADKGCESLQSSSLR